MERELATLHLLFRELTHSDIDRFWVEGFQRRKIMLSKGAERWTLIPNWDKIGHTYNEAFERVLALLKQTRDGKLFNYNKGELGTRFLHEHEHTMAMWKMLGNQQAGYDILIVPVQFGLLHRGQSVYRARQVFNENEFGLGAFAVGIMLLTHRDRLQHKDDLYINCPGDDYESRDSAGARYPSVLTFSFHDGDEREHYPFLAELRRL